MKYLCVFLLLVVVGCGDSAAVKGDLTGAERDAFMSSCIPAAKENHKINDIAADYCACMVNVVAEKWSKEEREKMGAYELIRRMFEEGHADRCVEGATPKK